MASLACTGGLAGETRWVEDLDGARDLVARAGSVVALTGAGISTDSGIPDFRGPQGVWTRNPEAERLSDIRHYLADPEIRRRSWASRLDAPAWTAEPNPGHHALAQLEQAGRLDWLLTQNIDGLHQAAGSDPELVAALQAAVAASPDKVGLRLHLARAPAVG